VRRRGQHHDRDDQPQDRPPPGTACALAPSWPRPSRSCPPGPRRPSARSGCPAPPGPGRPCGPSSPAHAGAAGRERPGRCRHRATSRSSSRPRCAAAGHFRADTKAGEKRPPGWSPGSCTPRGPPRRCRGHPAALLVAAAVPRLRPVQCRMRGRTRPGHPLRPTRKAEHDRRSRPAHAAGSSADGITRPEPGRIIPIGLDQCHDWSRPQGSRYQHGFSTRSGNDGK
jgi:hypothetical protein